MCAGSTRSPRRCSISGVTGCWRAARRRCGAPNEKSPHDSELKELKKRVAHLERALGRKTYELEIAGKLLRDWE